MGTFHVKCRVANHVDRGRFVDVSGLLVDTGSDVGFAIIRVGPFVTVDEVVFAEPGDLLLLGARTLEGLDLTVDAAGKRLIPGGPHPAALATR